jgi:hypothetical protein
MEGFPIHCGWIDAMNFAIERMKTGIIMRRITQYNIVIIV